MLGGLLDLFKNMTPEQRMGLLSASAAMMQSKGNFGQAAGAGLQQGLLGYQGAMGQKDRRADAEQERKYRALQMGEMERRGQEQEQVRSLATRAFAPPQTAPNDPYEAHQTPGGGGMPEFAKGLLQIDPMKAMRVQQQIAQSERPDYMPVSAGASVFDKRAGKPVYTAPEKTPDWMNPDYQKFQMDKAKAGSARVQTNVNAFTPASEVAQAEFMKSSRATYDQLKQAPVALESIERAKALVPSARGFMGPGGESLLTAAKFLNARIGTNIKTEGVRDAEELRTRIYFNIMDNLKKMDAQPSQQQQQIMQESLGKLGTDPNALPAVLDAFGDVIRGKVDLHNAEVRGATERGVKFPYDPIVKLKERKAAPQISSGSDPLSLNINGQTVKFPSAAALQAYKKQMGL